MQVGMPSFQRCARSPLATLHSVLCAVARGSQYVVVRHVVVGAAASRKQQVARKRTASGGSATAVTVASNRATRLRSTASGAQQRAAEVLSVALGAAVIAEASTAAPPLETVPNVAVEEDHDAAVAGPSGRCFYEMSAPSVHAVLPPASGSGDSEATVTEDESPGRKGKRQAKGKKGRGGEWLLRHHMSHHHG